ncbi:hypothetical protein C8R43DRAFT_1237439 [Mycena crocata]|nr:hypothetical protein C8R43DRAFT_1237439 [Mycena crocata]
MSRLPSRPPQDNDNAYKQQPLQQGAYPHPPQQARPGPQRQISRPMRDPQPPAALQRQRSRPDDQLPSAVLQRQRSRPDQPYQPEQSQNVPPQRRPDPQYQERQHQQPPLQRQPSRPDQRPPPLQQPQPSRPDQNYPPQPMPESPYVYKELPMQPVQPAFVRAPSAPSLPSSDSQSTLFSPPSRPYADSIIRGNSDDELDKTDVFWRRFNASAVQQQQPDAEKSSWLEKNEGKSSRSRRRLWVAGLFLVLLAAGGIGIGIFLSFRNSSNATRPDALGGSADVTSGVGQTANGAAAATAGTGNLGTTTSSSLHVSPTNTVA